MRQIKQTFTAAAASLTGHASNVTGTDIDANGTLKISGTIKLTWINLGDY